MSAAQQSIPASAGIKQLGVALAAVVLAAALLLAVAYGQLAGSKSNAAPNAGSAPVTFDHGTSTEYQWAIAAGSSDSTTRGANGTRFAR